MLHTVNVSTEAVWNWSRSHSRQIAVIPLIVGLVSTFLTGQRPWIGLGVMWFLGVITIGTSIETLLSVCRKWRRSKRDVLTELLQFGGFSLFAGTMAAYFAIAYWTSGRPRWLVIVMFIGLAMSFSSALVYSARSRKPRS